jgi:hypothetical protein
MDPGLFRYNRTSHLPVITSLLGYELIVRQAASHCLELVTRLWRQARMHFCSVFLDNRKNPASTSFNEEVSVQT